MILQSLLVCLFGVSILHDFEEEVERRGLLKFVSPNISKINVLVIESLSYLRELRDLLPAAKILVLTDFNEVEAEFADLNLDWIFGDYKKFNFSIDEKIFDIIIAEDCLTFVYEPYKTLFGINRWLKETGFMVTQFENIRYIGVLESLRQGYYPERERRLYAKTEIVRLLNDSLFKEINFHSNEVIEYNIDDWLKFGFDNYNNELLTKTWIVKAGRSTSEVAALKQFYNPAIRKELARLLHRIEYDIDIEDNLQQLQKLCKENYIFDDYLYDFIDQIVIHREKLTNILADYHSDDDI